jgi:hypothetical protein
MADPGRSASLEIMLNNAFRMSWVTWVLSLAVAVLGLLAMASVESRNARVQIAASNGDSIGAQSGLRGESREILAADDGPTHRAGGRSLASRVILPSAR